MISVVIPTYNTALLIERTIRSVLNQKNISDFEIIIVDDCSTDNTLDIVRSINDPRIRIFCQAENRGPAAARNRGLAEARGEYFAYLDGDDYWEPEFLHKTKSFLEQHHEAVAVFTGQCHNSISQTGSIRPRCILQKTEPCEPRLLDNFFQFWSDQGFVVCTGSIMIRTDLLKKIGGQREDLRVCEDLELWCLIGLHGRIGFIPEVLFVSDGLNSKNNTRRVVFRKNLIRWKNAVPVENWCKRHKSVPNYEKIMGYEQVRSEVSGILIYCMIIDGRWAVARQSCCNYPPKPLSRINKLYRCFSRSRLLWTFFSFLLQTREYLKGIL